MHIPGYQIEREIGQGGMAIVYLATQESLHRPVALKVIKPVLSTDEEFAQRFLREGRIIAQLSDPHIVTVYDIAAHDHTYYLSMEYLPGGTLQQRIRNGLPLEEVLPIARAIASALHYAHRRNIIHRDIKPQNILFRENGTPVLTDFGIAKTLGTTTVMTRTGLSLGTPRYMSPEQIRGQMVDARADLYSFGVLFYEMLIGHVPFNAEDSFALAMMHVTAPIPELPPKLQTFQPLLNKLLDKDPGLRFQTGQEFITALDALDPNAHSLLTITDPTRKAVPIPAPARRRGWKVGALAAALAGVALGGGYWFLSQPGSPPPSSTSTQPPELPSVDLAAQRQAEAEQLLGQARQQQQAGALDASLGRIEQGLQLAPDHAGLLALKQEVSRQIAEAGARKAQEEEQARQQVQADQFLDLARSAFQEGKPDLSLVHIEQGLQAMPRHAGLLALKQEILLAQQTAAKRQETADRQKAEAEKQKAEAERQKAEAEQRRRKADEWLARALDSQRNRAYETSLNQIEQGLQQAPDHARLLALRDDVRRQLREAKAAPPPTETKPPLDDSAKVAALLRECDAHLRANRLTSGKGGNAADCYGEVLKLDRSNADALAGLDRVADRYADSAATAIQRGDTKAAKGYLDRVARLSPGYPRLGSLREQLAQAESAGKSSPPPTAEPPKKAETPVEPIDLVSTPQRTEPSAPPGPAGTGPAHLMVRSNVEDAEISINGRPIGTVPMQVEMKAGSYRVRVSQDGYNDWNGKIELKAGQDLTVQAALKKKSEPGAEAPPPTPARQASAAAPEPPDADRDAEKRATAAEQPPAPRTPAPQPQPQSQPQSQSQQPIARAGQAPNCLKGDCANGEGTYRYPDGSEYSGSFRSAKMHGEGTYTYAGRGEKYVGEWRNGVINGQGTYYYRSGNRYEGEWRNGHKSGQGTYFYTDRGDKYVGDFKNDQPNGQGTYYYGNGDRYEGEWSNGRKNGHGVMYQNGVKIVGEWRNDQKVQVSVEQ